MAKLIYFSVSVLFSTLIFQVMALETDNFKLENDTEASSRGLFGLFNPTACLNTLNKLNIPSAATPALVSATPLNRLSNGRVYFFAPAAAVVTWAQARDYCITHGMHLVTLETIRENQLVFAQAAALGLTNVAGGLGAWIGLRDTSTLQDWRWVLRNTRPTYTAFSAVPAAGASCVNYIGTPAVPTASWVATACATATPFICEMEPPCSVMAPAIQV